MLAVLMLWRNTAAVIKARCCLETPWEGVSQESSRASTHWLDFEAALARSGTDVEQGERETRALGRMGKPVLWLPALKDLLSNQLKTSFMVSRRPS